MFIRRGKKRTPGTTGKGKRSTPGTTGKVKRLTPGTIAGFTFIEVLVAVLVLAIVALAATPQLSSGDPARLELAATEVAAAIRFARSEAMRTGQVHSIFIDESKDQLTVERTALTTKPASAKGVLYHPIIKQPYDLILPQRPAMRDVVIDNAAGPFVFAVVGDQRRLMFDAAGVPLFIDTITNSTHLLTTGDVKLAQAALGLSVTVHPFTGRVTIQ